MKNIEKIKTGVLPIQEIKKALDSRIIQSQISIDDNQLQPASLDLRLGKRAWRLQASFLPGKKNKVIEKIHKFALHELNLKGGAVLEKGCVYLVELQESLNFPDPVISVAIEPETKADQEKLGMALNKLSIEDPSFKVKVDHETNQTIISGMGELHLEIIVDRLKREFNVEAKVGAPQVAYRETIRGSSEAEQNYIKKTGGKGQYGHVKIRIEPMDTGGGFEFVNEIKGGAIPREFIPAVEKGIQEAMSSGVVAGYEVVDVKVTLYDGSFHDVDSSEMAFKIPGSLAFKDAVKKAGPHVLEPMMKV